MADLAVIIGRGALASRPAAGIAGSLWYDTTNSQMTRDNGASWDVCEPAAGLADLTTTKGDLLARSASAIARLPIGTDTYVLTADSTKTLGMDWKAAAGGGAMTLISTQTLSSDAASITFPSIPGTYTHLHLILFGRSNNSAVNDLVYLRFNADTAANYDYEIVYSNNGAASSEALGTAAGLITTLSAATAPANVGSGCVIDIPVYAGTTFQKQAIAAGGTKQSTAAAGLVVREVALWWRNTAAITQIDLTCASGQFITGTIASLYGIS